MYEAYWKLRQPPFDGGTDPRAYYPAEGHQGALLKLRYVVENRRGAALLAGGSGVGKTLLLRLVAEQLPESCRPVVHMVYPQMPVAELLAYLAAELGGSAGSGATGGIAESIARIQRVVIERAEQRRHTVLAIDDAHLLDGPRSFEALRLLLNFESAGRPALTLILAGQPTLLAGLARMPQFDERFGAKCLVRPLSLEETISYAEHRLRVAGGERGVFDPAGLEALYQLAHGVPRRINRLCDLALLVGFAEELSSIGADQFRAVAEDLAMAAVD